MTKNIILSVLSCLLFSSVAMASTEEMSNEMSNEQSCKSWAKEDGIPKEGLEDYMVQCLAQMEESAELDEEIPPYDYQTDEEAIDAPLFGEELYEESSRNMDSLPPMKKSK